MSSSNDSVGKTLAVALGLCLVCSILVAGAAVTLRPIQKENKILDKKKNILITSGSFDPSQSIKAQFEKVEARVVNMETGQYNDQLDPFSFDERKAAADPKMAVDLDSNGAGIKTRSPYKVVYLVKDENQGIEQVILPIHGKGLWSTLYGFIALAPDLNTIKGLNFYEHKETPGLGGEVENPRWKAQWEGKKVYGDQGDVLAKVAKGTAPAGNDYQVDGLSGATITANGVTGTLQYWLGENGYGPYLNKLKTEI